MIGGGSRSDVASVTDVPAYSTTNGPEADYPMVLGDPYLIGGQRFVPADTFNFDQVGYAASDPAGGQTVTVSHRTLPMPSYVEITNLDTGKTILARVERRGPMAGDAIVALSAGARAQLGTGERSPVRVRRVNALENDRAKLRAGVAAPDRIDTPKSLLAVLQRKLQTSGGQNLAAQSVSAPAQLPGQVAQVAAAPVQVTNGPMPAPTANAAGSGFEKAFSAGRTAVTAYPLAPLDGQAPAQVRAPVVASRVAVAGPSAAPAPARTATPSAMFPEPSRARETAATEGNFVIQAAAFSSKANAERMASSIDGFVEKSGGLYCVRKGPFASRGQAEAALAKVRAAGYRDARVFTAG